MEASCSSAKPGFYLQKPSILQSLSSRPRSCLLAWMSAKTWVSMPYFYVLIGGFVMWMLLAPQELNSKWNLWLVLEGIELKATRCCTVPVKKSAGVKQLGWEQANVSLNTVSSVVDIRGPRKPMGWAESNGLSGCTVPDPQFVRQHRQKESVLIHSEWQAPFPSTAGMVKDKSLS